MKTRLYIHVPFCASKCAYCAFYSSTDRTLITRTVEMLTCQMEACGEVWDSVFIGGGNPMLLEENELSQLLKTVSNLSKTPGSEVSIEANPENLTPSKAAILARYGVNRVSMGVQSFDSALRRVLGRNGEGERFFDALTFLRANGIENVNADLIYAIPGQTLHGFETDVKRLLDIGIPHLSAYSLTPDEGSALSGTFEVSATERLSLEVWMKMNELIRPYGLKRYEISNYAKEGFACDHNAGIWLGDHYRGLGPSASGFDGRLRQTQVPDVNAWLSGHPPSEDPLGKEARAREILVFGLRTVQGWDPERFRLSSGFELSHFKALFQPLISEKLLKVEDGRLQPSEKGLLFWDTVAERLL